MSRGHAARRRAKARRGTRCICGATIGRCLCVREFNNAAGPRPARWPADRSRYEVVQRVRKAMFGGFLVQALLWAKERAP